MVAACVKGACGENMQEQCRILIEQCHEENTQRSESAKLGSVYHEENTNTSVLVQELINGNSGVKTWKPVE